MDVYLYKAAVVEGSIYDDAFLTSVNFKVFSDTGRYPFYYYQDEEYKACNDYLQAKSHNPATQGK